MQFPLLFLHFTSQCILYIIPSSNTLCSQKSTCNLQLALLLYRAFQVALVVKNLPANTQDERDVGSIPGLERVPGEGHGNQLQYSCLENSKGRGVWQAIVHWVTKRWT